MHVANCEYLLLSISCEMDTEQPLFVVDLNERRSDSTNLVWSIEGMLKVFIFLGLCAVFGTTQHIRNFQNTLERR